jgi:hypothetical protein
VGLGRPAAHPRWSSRQSGSGATHSDCRAPSDCKRRNPPASDRLQTATLELATTALAMTALIILIWMPSYDGTGNSYARDCLVTDFVDQRRGGGA